MHYTISKPTKNIDGELIIPSSKSISNRVQIINALSYSSEPIRNLSTCDDSKVMQKILSSNERIFDVDHAGTSMRFLTAYLSKILGEWTLTGSHRMKQRPISLLVDALNSLGAQITYLEKEGFPPLKIMGSNITGKEVELAGNTSSQYISALLLIAPTLENGLKIKLQGKIVSRSYIDMTLNIMREFGIQSLFKNNEIHITKQDYKVIPYTVEGDWSSASYWYAFMALASQGKLELKGLKKNSLQGDSGLVQVFSQLGVTTTFSKKGTSIEKNNSVCKKLNFDFIDMPDLAQTFAVVAALKNIPFHFKGLETLKIKETNRIAALITELAKLGYILYEPNKGELAWNGEMKTESKNITIETYHDHRMAMAFTPLAMLRPNIKIADPLVVNKSYPNFWDQLKKIGFQITEN